MLWPDSVQQIKKWNISFYEWYDHLTKRISANRVSGTLKNKVLNCDKRGYKMVAINHILSTIKNVLPREYVEKKIFI
jgi:hypothetical protein